MRKSWLLAVLNALGHLDPVSVRARPAHGAHGAHGALAAGVTLCRELPLGSR